MAIIPIVSQTIDPDTIVIQWGPMNGGDQGAPLQVWAYPKLSWQLTGYAQGGVITNPDVPVSSDRVIEVHGSNDATCFGLIFEMIANPSGMATRFYDPVRDGSDDQRFWWIKPIVLGSVNPQGPDCGVLLLAYRPFSDRP